MADNDDRRVEPRPMVIRSGNNATAEGIKELEERRLQNERLARPKPATPFSAVLAKKATKKVRRDDSAKTGEKEKRLAALPEKGPAPDLLHPAQRDAYGRDDAEGRESVILKG